MILKKGSDPKKTKSYRPISITPCIARLFERLMLARLKKHLTDGNILITAQSGFRNHRQTKDNIIFLSQKVQESFAEKKKTLAIFFDVESAFDKVWHNGLIYKLAKMRIPFYIINIIKDFISGRSFKVKVNGSYSKIRSIFRGLPQGAVFSPTLYNLFTNDLPIKNHQRLHNKEQEFSLLFADDIAYLLSFKCPNDAKIIAQKYLNELEHWTNLWRLKLAPHKSSHIVFSRARKFDIKEIDLVINGIKIPRDDEPKFLGIKFDRRLNFSAQINNIKSKLMDRTNIMKIISFDPLWKVQEDTMVQLYKSLIRSVIEYSSFLIDSISKSYIKTLEAVQNNILRIIYKKKWDELSTDELRDRAKVSTIESRLKTLNENYFSTAITTENPLISNLIDHFLEFQVNNKNPESKCKTILNSINIIREYFDVPQTRP